MTAGLTALKDAMTDIPAGRNTEAQQMMRALQLNLADMKGPVDFFFKLRDRLAQVNKVNPSLAARGAKALLGGAAEDLWPVLTRSPADMARYSKEADSVGGLTDDQIKKADKLRESLTKLTETGETFGEKLGSAVSPAVEALANGIQSVISKDQDWIAQKVSEYATQIADSLKKADWKGYAEDIKEVIDDLKELKTLVFGTDDPAAPWYERRFTATTPETSVAGAAPWLTTDEQQRLVAGVRAGGVPIPDDDEEPTDGGLGGRLYHWLFGGTPGLPYRIESEVRARARALGLDENRMVALARTESGGYKRVSPARAIGPMQLMPGTARDMGVASDVNDPAYDWRKNVDAGERYFQRLLSRYGGNYDVAEAAYNAGPDNPGVRRLALTGDPSELPAETQRYLASIDGIAPGAPEPDTGGRAEVVIRFQNPPAGLQAFSSSQGALKVTVAPPVEHAMEQSGALP